MSEVFKAAKEDVERKRAIVDKLEEELDEARNALSTSMNKLSEVCPHDNTTYLVSTGYDSCDDCGELL